MQAQLPPPELEGSAGESFAEFFGYQHFPATVPTEDNPHPPRTDKDRNFALCGHVAGVWSIEGLAETQERLKKLLPSGEVTESGWEAKLELGTIMGRPEIRAVAIIAAILVRNGKTSWRFVWGPAFLNTC